MKKKSYVDEHGEAQELDDGFFKEARRGRPPLPKEERKVKVTIMLDADVVESYKRGGKGWQTRVNRDLRGVVEVPTKRAARTHASVVETSTVRAAERHVVIHDRNGRAGRATRPDKAKKKA